MSWFHVRSIAVNHFLSYLNKGKIKSKVKFFFRSSW